MSEPTIFTRILRGEIPSEIIAETENVFAIRDIAPQAPVHLLVIPKTDEYRNVVELAAGDPALLTEMIGLANALAAEHADGDFRLVFNTGPGAGQTVFHVHAHVLAGGLVEGASVADEISEEGPDVTERIYADGVAMVQLLGPQDRLLRVVEREHRDVQVHVRGNEITLSGPADAVARARTLVEELIAMSRSGQGLDPGDVATSERILRADGGQRPSEVIGEAILTSRGRVIRPKTVGQKSYVDAIDENTITFGIGPAGTGKTYLAMAKAVQALQRKEVSRIILSRPAIEAGERLGFLPGNLNDKIDPYLRPLYDALNEMMDPEIVPKLMASGTIEVAPLAYMRGRTLNDAFVVLDEAQNTTPEQMKMFLTRLGFGTRMVVTGDITQVDLPQGASGLRLVTRVLKSIDDIEFSYLTSDDVVRHTLVGRIVDAYTEYDEKRLAERHERDEASAFVAAREGNRAQRRAAQTRPGGPRDHLPQRGKS